MSRYTTICSHCGKEHCLSEKYDHIFVVKAPPTLVEWYEVAAERIMQMLLDRQKQCWPLSADDTKGIATIIRYESNECRGKAQDKIATAVMKNIADGFYEGGHFVQKFAKMFISGTEVQKRCLMPAVHNVIKEFKLEEIQRERGILHASQYE